MPTYSNGAARAIQTLKAAEDDRGIVWAIPSLVALHDLSPVESVLALALNKDKVWEWPMRQDARRRAKLDHVPGDNGFTLGLLLERAERFANEEDTSQISERHLARGLVELLPGDFARLGVDGQQLVAEVAMMEQGDQEQRVRQGLEWEDLRFVEEEAQLLQRAQEECQRLRSNLQSRGVLHSSTLTGGVFQAYFKMLEDAVEARIRLRREITRTVRQLASPDHLARLGESLERYVDTRWLNLPGLMVRWCQEMASEEDLRRELTSGAWAGQAEHLNRRATHRLKVLEREVALGMMEPKRPEVVLNITDSNVAGLNLGSVMGNIQAFVVSLQNEGNPDLARALKQLIEAVAATEALGAERTEVIESLTTIGEHAVLPQSQRRPGLVRTLMNSLGATLAHVANLAQIWSAVGPMIARHFGLPWP